MTTSIHCEVLSEIAMGDLRVVESRSPTLGIIWSVYYPDHPFGMKVGKTKAEALAKWFAANPVKVAA